MAKKSFPTGWVVFGVVVLVLLGIVMWVIGAYNNLITLELNVNNQWAKVETQYQRRIDLIPNYVNTVKGYAKHEEKVFTEIAALRSQWGAAKSVNEKVGVASQMESALARLLVVVENYPELKANENFLALQDELAGTENRIAVERTRYNDEVNKYNIYKKRFPTVIIANLFGFQDKSFFEAAKGAEIAPTVSFE
ncbi:MAG: LemA family protein [Candidatus Woesearchaeota archaeon]